MQAPAAKSKMPCRGEKNACGRFHAPGRGGKTASGAGKENRKRKQKNEKKPLSHTGEAVFPFLRLLSAEHFGSAAHVLDDGHLERAARLASAAGNAVACMRAQQRVVFAHRLGDFALRARKV